MAAKRTSTKKLDALIDEIVRRRCSGMPISIMDIPKVFAAGRAALAAGENVEDAVVSTYTSLSSK